MRRLLLAAAAAFVLAAALACSQTGHSRASDEQAIRSTIEELMAALNRNDVEAAGRIYADDYAIVLADGSTTTKAQRLAALKSGELKYLSLAFDNLKVRQYGDAAVANYHVSGKSVGRAGERDENSQAMVMLVKKDGRWQVVSSQLTDSAASPSGAPGEKALDQLLDDYIAALGKNSAEAVGPFLSGQYVRVGPDGSMLNKDQALAALRSGDLKYASVVADERVWRMFGGDTAVSTSRVTLKGTLGGREMGGTYRATTMLRKEGARWVLVSTHLSPLAAR
jgi:uncharacterized protein (TIGR02246 family)